MLSAVKEFDRVYLTYGKKYWKIEWRKRYPILDLKGV